MLSLRCWKTSAAQKMIGNKPISRTEHSVKWDADTSLQTRAEVHQCHYPDPHFEPSEKGEKKINK